MVTVLLLTLLSIQPTTPPPAQQAPTTKPRPPVSSATTAAITVTDGTGTGIGGVLVQAIGPLEREGRTTADGMLRLQGLRAGTYRLRFSRDGFYTFEKEITWRAGQPVPDVAVTLTAAPPPPPPTPAPAPAPTPPTPKLPDPGQATTLQLPDFIEKNFISSKDPHKEDLVGCSGVGQAIIWQVLAPWEDRQHTGADAMLYVIGGEGTIKLNGRDIVLGAGSFSVVPRGARYSLSRRGRNPLIVLAVLSGAPCAA
jgi:Carboxypeptidase regulatory-like domain/Cupin domain